MKLHISEKEAVIAVVGHVGCGHCHSNKKFVQDDSGGLATVLSLFQEATGISLTIKEVRVVSGIAGYIEVETESGGVGRASARRGITIHEAKLAKSIVGRQAIRTHTLVMEVFGRFYGQGVHEVPVALQTAIANAALDSFAKNFPGKFIAGYEDVTGSCGMIVGAVLDFNEIAVAVVGTVNASKGGIGPNEDLEGNNAVGIKHEIMSRLGMLDIPTIVVEGKVYWPELSNKLDQPTFLIRADSIADNLFVAHSMYNTAKSLGYPVQINTEALPRVAGAMKKSTQILGQRIADLGYNLQNAEYAQEKVNILADLAILVSQDGGGVSFMSNKLHEIIGPIGMTPGTSAVLSYIVEKKYQDNYVIPFITEVDLNNFVRIVKNSIEEITKVLPEATAYASQLAYVEMLDELILKK